MRTSTFFRWSACSFASSARFLVPLLVLLASSANAGAQTLACQVNQTDGVSLKTGQSMIENTLGRVIKQGTVVEMTVRVQPPIGKVTFVTNRVAAPATLQSHDKISGGTTPPNGKSCTAKIALVQPKDTVTAKTPPQISK